MSGFAPSKFQFLTTSGAPNAGGTINVYQSGTTTPVTIYNDGALSSPASNPFTLDANGEAKFYVSGTTNLRIDSYTAAAGFIETIDPVFPVGGGAGQNAVVYKSSNYSIQSTDSSSNLIATNAITFTLPLTTGLTTSFNFQFNAQGGALTFSPQVSDKIQQGSIGAAYTVPQGFSGEMWTDANGNWGINFYGLGSSLSAGNILGNPTAASAAAKTFFMPIPANGQLQLKSSTQVQLMPFKGNAVLFPNGYLYTIPSGGLASGSVNGGCNLNGTANSTLSATTLYYVYLWYNGGTPALDFSATGHATDTTTGIEIKSGDATRVLVGMLYTQSGPTVADSGANRLVASWHNRQNKFCLNAFTTNRTTTSTSYVEINSEIRCQFVTWGDASNFSYTGTTTNTTSAQSANTQITTDGISNIVAGPVGNGNASGNVNVPTTLCSPAALSEGFHYATIAGEVSGNTGTWTSGSTGLGVQVLI